MSDISKYKSTSIGRALITKLQKVRRKINEDNDIYISKIHKDICDNFNKYNELLSLSNKNEFYMKLNLKKVFL
jgi:hypothetical protein